MTPTQYKAALKALGLSQHLAGDWLGIGRRTSQGYALGEYPVPEPRRRAATIKVCTPDPDRSSRNPMLSQKEINRAAGIDHSAYGNARGLMFVAWHPVHGFGPINEIALREQYDHAKTDVKLLSHTGDNLWKVVTVELKVAEAVLSTAGASAPAPTASAGKNACRRANAAGQGKT